MVYKIKKGSHYPSNSLLPKLFLNKQSFKWRITFSPECWYQIPEGGGQDFYDLNKLTGILIGIKKMHGSFRFVWVPNFDRPGFINLYAYSYDTIYGNGKRFPYFKYLMQVRTGTWFDAEINVKPGGMVLLNINDMMGEKAMAYYEDASKCRSGIIHRPYHGGNLTAPNNYSIEVDLTQIE